MRILWILFWQLKMTRWVNVVLPLAVMQPCCTRLVLRGLPFPLLVACLTFIFLTVIFWYMSQLLKFGPIAMALEGGYNEESMPKCVAACIQVLIGHSPDDIPCESEAAPSGSDSLPYDTTWSTILKVYCYCYFDLNFNWLQFL